MFGLTNWVLTEDQKLMMVIWCLTLWLMYQTWRIDKLTDAQTKRRTEIENLSKRVKILETVESVSLFFNIMPLAEQPLKHQEQLAKWKTHGGELKLFNVRLLDKDELPMMHDPLTALFVKYDDFWICIDTLCFTWEEGANDPAVQPRLALVEDYPLSQHVIVGTPQVPKTARITRAYLPPCSVMVFLKPA